MKRNKSAYFDGRATSYRRVPFDKAYCFKRRFLFAPLFLLATGFLPSLALAQYAVTALVSNQNAIGANPVDPALVNAWGLTSLATSPFWVSDNGTGKSTLYNTVRNNP